MNELYRHDTPAAVASVLAKHAPRGTRLILDPCVGSGALVEPLLARAASQRTKVICFDIDGQAVESTRRKFGSKLGTLLHVEQADFLSPRTKTLIRQRWSFADCVLLNPPFAGRTSSWRAISVPSHRGRNELKKFAPYEAVFLLNAVSLLADNGRLLAVLPASIISGVRCAWIRHELGLLGSILHVHELPRRTFPNVESRIYLLVFVRGRKSSKMVLCNHELSEPHRKVIDTRHLDPACRLDYNYYEARAWFEDFRTATPSLHWCLLSEVADIARGNATSNVQKERALHTTDKRDGFWQSQEHYIVSSPVSYVTVGHKDILLARVGRGCWKSVGFASGPLPARFSDCLFRVHAKAVSRRALLFAIRCVFGFPLMESIAVRGTGASYIAKTDLESIKIPVALASRYPSIYASYNDAVRAHDDRAMRLLENRVRGRLRSWVLRSRRKYTHD